jgi:pSer/pThr/pTyr-binding forkhead associated (FHA) protein
MSAGTTKTRLAVEGSGKLLAGVRRVLDPGDSIVVGRSRSCDISLRRSRGFQAHPDPERLLDSDDFRRVSRVHCEISFAKDGTVEIRDLSRNGTEVDGTRVVGRRVVEPNGDRVAVKLANGHFGRLVHATQRAG